ncbi:MAG: 3-isopropylmalate dehydrogenase [Gemmatimonadaceae bacterium]|nr:3-isopropylmalate dehydrogenase [Gemmatimonadaceae bacterium]
MSARTIRVAVLAGDGVGPEVTAEAVRVLHEVLRAAGHALTCTDALIGGAAIDATGEPFPAATRAMVADSDAVLLGAVGGAKWNTQPPALRPEAGLLALRRALGTFANLRPVRTFASMVDSTPLKPDVVRDTDILFVRELTGGAYFGAKARHADADGGEVATDDWRYTTTEVERVVRKAGALARTRRGHVTSVDKANVLATSQLWRDVTTRVLREEFPDVTLVHAYVDAFAMQVLRAPRDYDVVVTENLFGDILTDEAAVLAGSIGLLPSASLGALRADGTRVGLYEPIHGSAPDIAGRDVANPIGAIASVALMLRHSLGLPELADEVDASVQAVLDGGARTADLVAAGGTALGTHAMGEAVRERMSPTHAAG